jgi:5-methylcytosine-specific restriction enzyme A
VQKIVHSHKPGKYGSAMTKLHNNAAWHCRARFQLQREPLCAMCLAEGKVVAARIADQIEPHHNDPIKVWNGKLQSLCARIAREQEEVRGEPRL